MNSFYTIIRYVNNQWSEENLAVGIVLFSENKVYSKFSERKIKLIQKLNPESYRLFKFSLDQLKSFIHQERSLLVERAQQSMGFKKSVLNRSFFDGLTHYNKGLIQFSEPESIEKSFDQALFEDYFRKIIDPIESESKRVVVESAFERKIEEKLYEPLREKVDVNYNLKMGSLPSLYFDFHFDNIGVNGSIIASTSLDFESLQGNHIKNKLNAYVAVIDRLKKFAKSRSLNSDHSFYLIANPYKGPISANKELDKILSKSSDFPFTRIPISKIDEIVRKVEQKGAHKFSEWIGPVDSL